MEKIIIGIHGLANKPEKEILEEWWKKSITEGLETNFRINQQAVDFRMVFWANLLYRFQQHTDEDFDFDGLYNAQPYIEAEEGVLKDYKDSWFDDFVSSIKDVGGSAIDLMRLHVNVDRITDWFLGKLVRDLDFYCDIDRKIKNRTNQLEQARKVLQDELKNVLLEEKEKDIMLIAHSMGSIIAYDVLRDLGQTDLEVKISHFITIGSPLGLPLVKGKIIQERGYDAVVRTPSIVTKSWVNFADKKDKVAIDSHLSDDYDKNRAGVRVIDDLVANDYKSNLGDHNHHKSYGYLRTPELSNHIKEFLGL
jgi:hypothetical protein